MRMLPLAFLALLTSPAFAVPDNPSYPVKPDTPSGTGDPSAVTCRAPQALAGGGMGPKICMKNEIWVRLSLTGKDLSADGKSVFDRPSVESPKGDGNPDAVTCRKKVALTASRNHFGPQVCLTNAQWKEINDKGMYISSMGQLFLHATGPGSNGAFPVINVENSPPL
jgi:hypothetical protein